MKRFFRHKVLITVIMFALCFVVSSCSSWHKSKCGECPRWTYEQTTQNFNDIA